MRKNYRQRIAKQNTYYYHALFFIIISYVLSVICLFFFPSVTSSLGGILAIAFFAFLITVYIFNFTGFKKKLFEEIENNIKRYEEKQNSESKN